MSIKQAFTLSSLSLTSEDWDRSESDHVPPPNGRVASGAAAPRNTVAFPTDGAGEPSRRGCTGRGGRSLSELMRVHAEKGTDVTFTAEEASRVADVLKQWINSGTSPYEGEDDFFSRSHDDSALTLRRSSRPPASRYGRPRGQSESVVTRSPSS